MLRRPFCGMAVSFLLGILVAAYYDKEFVVWILFGVSVTVGLCLAKYMRGTKWRIFIRICLLAMMVLLGYRVYERDEQIRGMYLEYLADGDKLTVQGEVVSRQFRNHQFIYELTSCYIGPYQNLIYAREPIPCNQVLAYSDSDVASIGEILILNGTVELWESATNEGSFDAKSFYLARKIDFKLTEFEIVERHGSVCWWREWLYQWKCRLKNIYEETMSSEACGVAVTMMLGDKELLEDEIKALYQSAGLSHLMSISGLHISVIGMTLYQFLRKRGIGFCVSGAIAGATLYAYGVMVGMGTSVERSIGMFFLFLMAQAVGRAYDSLNSLGILALYLLWKNPFLLWDAGFQLSFFAIIGVVWVGNCVSFEGEAHEKLKKNVFLGVTAQLATLPLVAWHFYEMPTYAILANLLVLPFVNALMIVGIGGGLLGLITTQGAAFVLFFMEKILDIVLVICRLCENLPGCMLIVGRPKMWQMVFFYAVLAGVTLLEYRRKERQLGEGVKRKGSKSKQAEIADLKRAVRRITVLVGLLVILIFPGELGFSMNFLDVGQGEGVFLRTEQNQTIFIDGGSSNKKKIGQYSLLPFLKYKGVRKIDFWFVSHTDEDHVSGLRELLQMGYEIEHLIFAEGIVQDEVYAELCELARENKTQIGYMSAGDTLHIGDARIHALYPKDVCLNADKNEMSLVLWYEEAYFSALFTGDIGSEQELEVMEMIQQAYQDGRISDRCLEVYKVAHHGSKYSNSLEFLEFLQPEVAVISCAKRNSYGHPGEETIANLERVGCEILYTMEQGQVTIEKEELCK